MRTIVFTNQKGGPGKTTLSVLFAQWLVDRQRQRVCFIDLDSQRNASRTLHAAGSGVDAASLFAGETSLAPWVDDRPLRLMAGSRALIDVERARPEAVLPVFLRRTAELGSCCDVCVIDTPPSLGLRMSAALMAADFVVCPIELEEYSIDGLTDMLKTVLGVRRKYNPRLQLPRVVVNRFNPLSARQKEALTRLMSSYSDYVVPGKVSTRTAIPESLATGELLWRMTKTSARDASAEVEGVFNLLHAWMDQPSAVAKEVA
jgi:chromosome partitioning protein